MCSLSHPHRCLSQQANTHFLPKYSIPHSTFCNYNFTVVASSAGGKPVVCALTLQGPDTLPEVPLQGCSGGSWYSWSVAKPADGGLNLTVTTELSATTNVTGFYEIPASNLTTTQSGASTSQSYTGPQKLTLPASVVPA